MATSAADPEDLKAFVDQAATARDDLAATTAGVRATYHQVTPGLRDYPLPEHGLWRAFDTHLSQAHDREIFVAGVRQAFLDADTGSLTSNGAVVVDDNAIASELRKRGVGDLPKTVITIDAPEVRGRPADSGWADDPVCTANGNFVESELDLPLPARAGLIGWRRTYNSRSRGSEGAHGRGWSSWADTALVVSTDVLRWCGLDGAESTLPRPAPGAATAMPLLDAVLTATTDGFRLERHGGSARGGETWWYDSAGRPVHVEADGTEARLSWAGPRLTRLTHPGSGRSVTVRWDDTVGADDRGRIAAVTSSDGREVRYAYDDEGDLVGAVGTPRGPRHYEVSSGLVLAVTDADGVVEARNTYDPAGRVLRQLSPDGRSTTYSYEEGRLTVVTDEAGGAANLYQHDAAGRLVAVTDGRSATLRRSFDAAGRLTGVRTRSGGQWRMSHDADGNLAQRSGPGDVTEQREWDELRRLVSHTDSGGAVTRWSYAGTQRTPVEIIDPVGAVTRITVSAEDLPNCIVDPDGVSTHLRWDGDGQLTGVRGAEGVRTELRYDAAGTLVAIVDAGGVETRWETDATGNVVVEHAPAGRTRQFTYTAAGRVSRHTDPAGGIWRSTYGVHGRLADVGDPLGSRVAFDYDQFGNTTLVVAPDGQKYRFGYDALSRPVITTDPAGATTLADFDAEGRLVAETDSQGNSWNRRHDAAGRVVLATAPDGRSWRRDYDQVGNVIAETDPAGRATRYEHDARHRVVGVIDPAGRRTAIVWTPAGRLSSVTSPGSRTTSYGYDRAGRLVEIQHPSGRRVRLGLDGCGRVTSVTSPSERVTRMTYNPAGEVETTTDPAGRRVHFEYNPLGLPARVTGADGATRTFSYDARGALVHAVDPLGATTHYRHDSRGRLAGWTDPLGGRWSQRYDEVGRLTAHTDPLARTTSLARDPAGRVVGRRYADGTGQRWWRDACGQVTGIGALGDGSPRVGYSYDQAGRLVAAHEDGRDVALTYDQAGQLVSRTTPAGTLTWDYDDDGRCVATGSGGAEPFRFGYDDDGLLVSVSHPELGVRAVPRHPDGELWTAGESREHDAAGRVVRAVRGPAAGGPAELRYGYDAAGQLIRAEGPWGTQEISWDAAGRRIAERGPAGVTACRYDAAGQLTDLRRPDGTSSRFRYDAAGRRTGQDADDGTATTYSWDRIGRLESVVRTDRLGLRTDHRLICDGGGDPIQVDDAPIRWDPLSWPGQARAVDETAFSWIGAAIAAVSLGGANAGPGERTGLNAATAQGTGWWETDGQGSLGTFDPWGVALDGATASPAAFPGFRGELMVGDLVWQRDRVLDPATRSFLSPDPLPHVPGMPCAGNPYHYAWNDPVGFLDPTGQRPLTDAEFQAHQDQERKGSFGRAWDAVKEDPWGTLAAVGVVAVGVGLMFVPGGQAVGAGILIGAAVSGGIGLATGNFDPRQVAIGGVMGGIGGPLGGLIGKATGPALARFGPLAAEAGSAAVRGAAEDVIGQQLNHPGSLNTGSVVASAVTGGLLGGSPGKIRPARLHSQADDAFAAAGKARFTADANGIVQDGAPDVPGLARTHADDIRSAATGRRPTMAGVAVDTRTGQVYFNNSGKPWPTEFDPVLQRQMPNPSLKEWQPQNCAEFKAVNDALSDGARMEDIQYAAARVSTGASMPACPNCQISLQGAKEILP